jgi:hypothetical protein
MEDYLPVLRCLHLAGVNYAVIGTWALKAYFPAKMADYVLHDCDVVLAPDEANVRLAVQILNAEGWETRVWDECVDAGSSSADFVGKYYVRAKQHELVLDLTYECLIAWPHMNAHRLLVDGRWLASVGDVATLKRWKGTAADLDLLYSLRL